MKIVLTDCKTVSRGDVDLSVFENYGETVYYELSSQEELKERVKDADAILCNKSQITAEIIDAAERLKYIGLFATGYNNIDIEAAKKRGITVCNAGSYSTNAVAQQVFAYILNYFNNVSIYSVFVNKGGWRESETFSPFVLKMQEMAGKKIGIVGYGSIGQKVAEIAKAFSMEVLVYARHPSDDPSVNFVDFDTLLKESDIVTAHCPLNKDSEKMFNREAFSKFKTGAYFINTARGGIVEESALKDALLCGKLGGAAIDVLETEPMTEDCELINLPGLTITPHVAWSPIETRNRLIGIVADNLESFMEGNPKNVVS